MTGAGSWHFRALGEAAVAGPFAAPGRPAPSRLSKLGRAPGRKNFFQVANSAARLPPPLRPSPRTSLPAFQKVTQLSSPPAGDRGGGAFQGNAGREKAG